MKKRKVKHDNYQLITMTVTNTTPDKTYNLTNTKLSIISLNNINSLLKTKKKNSLRS